MKRRLTILPLVILAFLLCLAPLYAETENTILNVSGGGEGYSTAIVTDPDKIPLLMIRPVGNTRLDSLVFEIRLTRAQWDLDTYRSKGIEDLGTVDAKGVFTPSYGMYGYLTSVRDPEGGHYSLEVKEDSDGKVAVVKLEAGFLLDSDMAIYVPILVEITDVNPYLELYTDFALDLSIEDMLYFARESAGGVKTQVRPGQIRSFTTSVTLADLTIREMSANAIRSGIMTISAPSGLQWVDLDSIEVSGVTTDGGVEIVSVSYGNEAIPGATVNRSELKIDLRKGANSARAGAMVIRNLSLMAVPGNSEAGETKVTLSGCNIDTETVYVAQRLRLEYSLSAEARTLPNLMAGYNPADPMSPGVATLRVTFEEDRAGTWRPYVPTTFTLPEGVSARAVVLNTRNMSHDLPRDSVINRLGDGAYGLNVGETYGSWVLTSQGLTVDKASTKIGEAARIELLFYVSVSDSFSGPITLTAGGLGISYTETVTIGMVEESPLASASVVLTIGSYEMRLGGQTMQMDVAPFIENGYTMVPVSYVARALGLDGDSVVWDGDSRTVTIDTGSRVVVLTIDSVYMVIDGVEEEIAQAPIIRNDRTFLPFRVLGERVLGVSVNWDEVTRTAAFS